MLSITNLALEIQQREQDIARFGYVRITEDLCRFFAKFGSWVEIGAGQGLLSKGIRKVGGNCIATDLHTWHEFDNNWNTKNSIWADAEVVGQLVAKYPKIGLLCSWPSYQGDWCFNAVSHLQSNQLFGYIGEFGGCTGDDQLHEMLSTEFDLIDSMPTDSYSFIHDKVYIFKRK